MSAVEVATGVVDRIKGSLVGLKMPMALEIVDVILRRIEHGEVSTLEAIDLLLSEELTLRETRRVKTALVMARPVDHQDAGRLRLRVPAHARPQSRPGLGRVEVHRACGGAAPPGATRHRQKPSGCGARRGSREGRLQRILRDTGRSRGRLSQG